MQKTTKKVIYHSQSDTTKAGRTIRALLGFLTAGRYSLIFSFKITMVKREYNERRMRERAIENLFMVLVFTPLIIGITMYMEKCNNPITIIDKTENDTIKVDSMSPHGLYRPFAPFVDAVQE